MSGRRCTRSVLFFFMLSWLCFGALGYARQDGPAKVGSSQDATIKAGGSDPVTFPNDPVLGNLPPHTEIVIEFQVDVANPLAMSATEVCNQATVSGTGFASVTTDDPTTGAAGDATCTGLQAADWGDAPDPMYPTLAANNGARHLSSGPTLGTLKDGEGDGQPNGTATGDDLAGSDDEDGVSFSAMLIPGMTPAVDVTVTGGPARLDAWVDFNGNGSWGDIGEKIFDGLVVNTGLNSPTFSVPMGATPGFTFARFRLSTAGVADPTGEAPDGEVEDYRVTIENPSISVTKTAGAAPDEPGGTVQFAVNVTNNGSLLAFLEGFSDSIYGDITTVAGAITATTCTLPHELGIGLSYDCTFDVALSCNAGDSETNILSATGTAGGVAVAAMDSETVVCGASAPSITVTKTPDVLTVDEPGGSVTYTVTVANTSVSSDPVTITSLTDDLEGDLNGQGTCAVPQVIASGGSYQCAFTVMISGNAGDTVTNIVTASGTDDDTAAVSNTGSASVDIVDAEPSITVSKTPSVPTVTEPGGAVTYTVLVTNTSVSSDPVTIDTLTDDLEGDLNGQGDCSVPQVIASGGNYSCQFTVNLNGNAGDVITNIVTASGQDDDTTPVSNTGQASVTITNVLPSITVTKGADVSIITEPGGPVTYTVEITNTSVSSDPVTLNTLTDDLEGDLNGQGDCAVPQVIASGGSYSCQFTVNVTGTAGDEITNVVTAAGQDDDGSPVSGQAQATVGVEGIDFGDAPDPTYPTLLASNGARHTIPPAFTVFLGSALDHESDGQPSADLDGDDADGTDDEDGVTFTSVPLPGGTGDVDVEASAAGLLDAWVDFDDDGSFGAGEQIFTNEPLTAGVNSLVYNAPAVFGAGDLVSRFRFSSAGGTSPTGLAADGEVEDHLLSVDSTPPTVVSVTAFGDPLEACETLASQQLREIVVTFSETMVGHDDPNNYRIVRPGANGVFDTLDCTVSGDDFVLLPGDISDENPTARLITRPTDERYQLVICDSITDLAGNDLDGDEDTFEGGSFLRDFRLDSRNLFQNGHFDCDIASWDVNPPAAPEVAYDVADADNSGVSGSTLMSTLNIAGLALEQCVPVAPATPFQANPYELAGRFRVDAAASIEATLDRSCVFFDASACGGSMVGSAVLPGQILTDTLTGWLLFDNELTVPETAMSARCSFVFLNSDGGAPDAYLDQLIFDGSGPIFFDGFESGDFSAWATVVP